MGGFERAGPSDESPRFREYEGGQSEVSENLEEERFETESFRKQGSTYSHLTHLQRKHKNGKVDLTRPGERIPRDHNHR